MRTLLAHGIYVFISLFNMNVVNASNVIVANSTMDKEEPKLTESKVALMVSVLKYDGFDEVQIGKIKDDFLTALSMKDLVEKSYLTHKKKDSDIFDAKYLIGEFGACKTYSMGMDHRYSHCGEVIRKRHILKDITHKSDNFQKAIVYDIEKNTNGLHHKMISVDTNGIYISGKYTIIKNEKGMTFFDVYEWTYNSHLSLKYDLMNEMYTMSVNGSKYVFQIDNEKIVNQIK